MKKIIFTLVVGFISFNTYSQESLLDELLNVQSVEMKGEGSEEVQAEYQKNFDDEKARMEEDLAKLDEDYKKEVGSMIEDFNKVLEETVEQDVKNEKKRLITKVRTMTMTLKKSKKDIVTQFNNSMTKVLRELPKGNEGDKPTEVKALITEQMTNFDTQYTANLRVLETFKNTEHLTKSAETSAAVGN